MQSDDTDFSVPSFQNALLENFYIEQTDLLTPLHQSYIKTWLSDTLGAGKRFMLVRIFQGSEHGFFAQSFHYRCDKKGPTLSVIKTTTGRVFGGFCRKSWSCRNKVYEDSRAFVFSLNRLKYLRVKKRKKIVGCYKNKLVYFLNAICLNNKCDK